MRGAKVIDTEKLFKLKKEASARKWEQWLEGEEEHHNQTCLAAGNSGKGEN